MKLSRDKIQRMVGTNAGGSVSGSGGGSEIGISTVPWTRVTDPLRSGTNDFSFIDSEPPLNKIQINGMTRAGTPLTTSIQEYNFANGIGSRAGVIVRAANFFADTAVSVVSDERKKDIINGLRLDLDKIAAAPSILFKWKDKRDDTQHVGTIAQYWRDILPEVVTQDDQGELSMQYGVAALVSVISLGREVLELKDKLARHGIE